MPRLSPRVRRAALTVTAGIAALALAGCATAPASADPDSEDAAAAASVTIDNCGTEITLDSAPERVLTIKSTTFELMLALGLEDRIIGTAFPDGPVPENLADATASIPQISDKVPSQEAALELEPDLIFGGWESNFSLEGVGEREMLATLGVTTYVAPAACKSPEYMPSPLTFDHVFDGFAEAGELFSAESAAEELIAQQQAQLAEIEPDDRELTTLWYSSGSKEPFVGAGIGAPEMIMSAAGLVNIFSDVADTWTSTSWEVVADENPDVIVLVDAAWNTAESKIEMLKADPVASTMDAVAEERFIIVDFAATEAGIRNVGAVEALVEQLGSL